MRLLNTTTLDLHEFIGQDIPDYAILSHRWGQEEVTLQDFRREDRGSKMAGYSKIEGCCKQAAREGWEYAWIDSCCIDKTSSAELSEAINSMFKWYKNAQVCFVYLNDVPSQDREHHLDDSSFRRSKWFTRGWTLQELLAPEYVEFYNESWVEIGTKSSLEDILKSITGITTFYNFMSRCVAEKMSWAARRETTRVEDVAYCLMGLFEINMPLLYGEGAEAFIRLQTEIMKAESDETIFAFTEPRTENWGPDVESGLLATSPLAFENSGDIRRARAPMDMPKSRYEYKPPWSLTNGLLHISRWIASSQNIPEAKPHIGDKSPKQYDVAFFDCLRQRKPNLRLAILLFRGITTDRSYIYEYPNVYARLWTEKLLWVDLSSILKTNPSSLREAEIHVRQLKPATYFASTDVPLLVFNTHALSRNQFSISQRLKSSNISYWKADDVNGPRLRIIYSNFPTREYAALMFSHPNRPKNLALFVKWDRNSTPRIQPFDYPQNRSLRDIASRVAGSSLSKQFRYDRISMPLGDESKSSISVSVRKVAEEGVKQYLVDIEVDPTGALKWPSPDVSFA